MVRVLHLLGDDPDFQTRRGVDAITRDAGPDFRSTARPLRPGGSGAATVGEALRLWRRDDGGHDVVHAWGLRALTAAAFAGTGPIVFSPTRFLGPRSVAWVRAVM